MLVNGTSSLAVPSAMQTMYELLIGETPKELPSVSFVRSCRVVVEVIGETPAAMKLADAPSWSQLWTDGTTRRQIPFAALVVGLMERMMTLSIRLLSCPAFSWKMRDGKRRPTGF
jgi:hypothetical protein